MNKTNYTQEKQYILKQLAMAKETLAKLRAFTLATNTTDNTLNGVGNGDLFGTESISGWDDCKHDSDERSSGLGMESPHSEFRGETSNDDKSTFACERLANVLGLQVSKLEDDLKASLLAYLEEMEEQKEELISCFDTMHTQLSKHHQICQEHYEEMARKDEHIGKLKMEKQTIEIEVENLRRENVKIKASKACTRENGYRISPGYVEPDELSETLMKENSHLREKIRKYETEDHVKLERKIVLQEKLCESYNRDVMTKDNLVKRLKAENSGLREDMKHLQDEIFRVNANRLNAEQDVMRLQQELQFSEEQISTLRGKLSSASGKTNYAEKCTRKENSSANISGESRLYELENELVALRVKYERYRDKLNDKERFLASLSKDNEDLKRELVAVKGEERALRIENERLQRENADKEIDRLSAETSTEVNTNKIHTMKDLLRDLEGRVNELEEQRNDQETRETELSREVMTNLEKYTQVEQTLYLAKKELTQLQGYYECSENKRQDLQHEADRCRETIASLEQRLHNKTVLEEEEKRISQVIEGNEGIEKVSQGEEFQRNEIQIKELEEALQSAREQNSLQRLRLDAHVTLMSRKDERIKELQNELIELRSQIESLTDEILKNNREMDSVLMSKRLLEQEVDLIKSRKLPAARALHREDAKEGSSLYNTAHSASPDSGFSGTEREKAIDKLRREILSQPQQPVLYEETSLATDETKKLQADLAIATRKLDETERRLTEVIAENENLKDREQEASVLQRRLEGELRKAIVENKELTENERKLSQSREDEQQLRRNDPLPISQQSTLETEALTAIEEPLIRESILQLDLGTSNVNAAEYLKYEPVKSQTDMIDQPDVLKSQNSPEGINFLQRKIDELQTEIQNYDQRLVTMNSKNEDLQCELTKAQDILKSERDTASQERENLHNEIEEIKRKIRDYETSLAEVKKENGSLSQDLQQAMDISKEDQQERKALEQRKMEYQERAEKLEGQIRDLNANLESKNKENRAMMEELRKKQENEGQENINEYLQRKNEELSYYETSLQNANKEKDELLSELAQAKDSVERKERERKVEEENREALQKIMQEELSAKDGEVAKLQKELVEVCEEKEHLSSLFDSFRETRTQTEDQLQSAQKTILDLEKQESTSRAKEKSLQQLLQRSEESNTNLQIQLGEAEKACKRKDKETRALQQQINLSQHGSEELQREVEDLRAKVAQEKAKMKQNAKNLQELQKENDHLRTQLEDSERALENFHQKNEKMVLQMEEAIRERDNDIEELKEEILLSEQHVHEIKSLSNDKQTKLSDLQAQLIESKEQSFSLSQEKAKLLRDLKEIENDVTDKEQRITVLEMGKTDDRRIISAQEERIDEFLSKLQEIENEASNLRKENERWKNSSEEASNNITELDILLKGTQNEKKDFEQQLLAAHESIADLETAFERGEDKISTTEDNLRVAKDQIAKLETQLEARQVEYQALERDYNETEREIEKSQETLHSYQNKITSLEKKLRDAEANISELEMARDNGLSNEQLLQQRFAKAREDIGKTEAENFELKEKQTKLERKLADVLSKQAVLEERKEELDKVNKELHKDMEYEREKRLALKQKVELKDRENDMIQRKIQNLEKSLTEHQELQSKGMEEKAKLRDELARTKKSVSELETTKENQEESMSEMEETLRETRGKMTTLEQSLEDTKRETMDLHEEVEELNRKLKYVKEENCELEKSLQIQKDISDGLRNNLAERDESVMASNYSRDVVERNLQTLKKDLAKKDTKLKMLQEQVEDLDGDVEKAGRRIKETEASNKKLTSEKDRLTKELADMRVKLAKAERSTVVSESEVPVVRVSEVQDTPVNAEKLIRDWSDKLNTAQTKVDDLESELLKDIKKHEARVHRTRPIPPDLRRKSADFVLADHERPSRFRSRQRPNLSRDSSVDSLRSTQSMLDYLDERTVDENILSTVASSATGNVSAIDIAPVHSDVFANSTPTTSETVTPTASEPSTPLTTGNGSPADSETEGPNGVHVKKAAAATKVMGRTTEKKGQMNDKELTEMQKSKDVEESKEKTGGQEEENPTDWQTANARELRIEPGDPLLQLAPKISADQVPTTSKSEDLLEIQGKGPEVDLLQIGEPKILDGTTERTTDNQHNSQRPMIDEKHPGLDTAEFKTEELHNATTADLQMNVQQSNSSGTTPDEGEWQITYCNTSSLNMLQDGNSFDAMAKEREHEPETECSQVLLLDDPPNESLSIRKQSEFDTKTDEKKEIEPQAIIEPPSDELFRFTALSFDNPSTFITASEEQNPSLVFQDNNLLVGFDPLDIPEPQMNLLDEGDILDPFEQLMRDIQRGDGKYFDTGDVTDDVNDDATGDFIETDANQNLIFDLQRKTERKNQDYSKSDTDDFTIDNSDGVISDDVDIVVTQNSTFDLQQTAEKNDDKALTNNRNFQLVERTKDDIVQQLRQTEPGSSQDGYYGDVIDYSKPVEPDVEAIESSEHGFYGDVKDYTKTSEPAPPQGRVTDESYDEIIKPRSEIEPVSLTDTSDDVIDFANPVLPPRRASDGDLIKPASLTYAYREDVTDFSKPLEQFRPPKKLKERMKPVLFPRKGKTKSKEKDKKKNKTSDSKSQGVVNVTEKVGVPTENLQNRENEKSKPNKPLIMAILPGKLSDQKDEHINAQTNQTNRLQFDNRAKSSSTHDSKRKPPRPPIPAVPTEFADADREDTFKSPSQIRREFEENQSFKRKDKPDRPPLPAIPPSFADTAEEDYVYKSPSQIRKELEEANKKGKRTSIAAKTVERQQKTRIAEDRSTLYRIEEKGETSAGDHTHSNDTQEKEKVEDKGRGRLTKLIAAFEKK